MSSNYPIELNVAVSRLDDIGFARSLLDPCIWLHREPSGELDSLKVLVVDDLVQGTLPDNMEGLRKKTESWFPLWKFDVNDTKFAGRSLTAGQFVFRGRWGRTFLRSRIQ